MSDESTQDLGSLLRETRGRTGISQRRLALRAGTSQDAVSRIERGAEKPTLERFEQLMLAMGQHPVVRIEPLESRVPAAELEFSAAMSPTERLREANGWNRTASQLALAGEKARRTGHPATRSTTDD